MREQRRWYYRLSQGVVGLIFRIYFRHQTEGINNLPENKGAVIATNHVSVLDPPMIMVDLPRPIHSMAKQSLHDIPLFGSLIRAFHTFPVRRGGFNRGAMRKAVEVLRDGNLLLMFPEGTRSRDGDLQRFRPGIGKIIMESGCGVLPGYLQGAFEACPPGSWLPRPRKTSFHLGEIENYSDVYDKHNRENYQKIADSIKNSIINIREQVED
ncbi:MAG: lysophospholipid acyltransferase family protein [bacterium]